MATGDEQQQLNEAADAIEPKDLAGLGRLTPEERRAQSDARWEMVEYVTKIWEDEKAAGGNPALNKEWSAVAGLRDLLMQMASAADQVIRELDE